VKANGGFGIPLQLPQFIGVNAPLVVLFRNKVVFCNFLVNFDLLRNSHVVVLVLVVRQVHACFMAWEIHVFFSLSLAGSVENLASPVATQ